MKKGKKTIKFKREEGKRPLYVQRFLLLEKEEGGKGWTLERLSLPLAVPPGAALKGDPMLKRTR